MATYSNPGLIELTNNDGKPPAFENFTKDSQLTIDKTGLTLTVQSYNWGTARATVKVSRGRWYYEVKISQSGQARIGWATYNYAPENRYDGVGSSSDSYGWDGSRKTAHHDDKKSGNSNGVAYGDYWSNGDIIGCLLDFDNCCISYTRNGKSMGIAFKNIKTVNPLMPCCSIYRGASLTLELGPSFKHLPMGFYGLNPTVTAPQKKSLLNVFLQYHKKGCSLSESLSRDVMKPQGVLALGNDLGCVDPMDPHLLLLAWKMRSKQFFQFYDCEWMVLWANEKVSSFDEMKKCVSRWMNEIKTNEDNYVSFYMFVFDYLRAQEGDTKLSLGKEDAIMAWKLLGMEKRFKFFPQWSKFWTENELKGVTRDTWALLLKFIEKVGDNVKNYNDDDCWPLVFDDFVHDYLLKK